MPVGINKQNVRHIVAGKFVTLSSDLSKHKLKPGFFFHGTSAAIFIFFLDNPERHNSDTINCQNKIVHQEDE
jgi:hypothetical protein